MTEPIESSGVSATLHRPDEARAAVVLAHGAGGNRDAAILVALAEEFARRGVAALRIDLPYRQNRPKGPPSPSGAARDRDGVRAAAALMRSMFGGVPLIVGGHSYGGRQTTMAVAEDSSIADGLMPTSYPLHPPGKPEKMRTEHFPTITLPTLFVHGTKDTFAKSDELADAVTAIPGAVRILTIEGANHDLSPKKLVSNKTSTGDLAVTAAEEFLLG